MAYITCPWCGTNYAAFQSNCQNCGGPLPAPQEPAELQEAATGVRIAPPPPPAPRPISDRYAWKLFWTDGAGIIGFAFTMIGIIFSFIGLILFLTIVAAVVGVIFLPLGMAFLAIGGILFYVRFQRARKTVNVLQHGQAALGRIQKATQNYTVSINNRHPWVIHYEFEAGGQAHQGQVTTLADLGPQHQPGKPAWVLYLSEDFRYNALYPHP